MPTITVADVGEPRQYEDNFGAKVAYPVTFTNPETGQPQMGQLSKKPDSPPPALGEQINVEILPSNNPAHLPRLKKIKDGVYVQNETESGNAVNVPSAAPVAAPNATQAPQGPPPSIFVDPRQAAIVRQHSQTTAVHWLAAMMAAGHWVPPGPDAEPENTMEVLRKVIDWFDDDVKQAVNAL